MDNIDAKLQEIDTLIDSVGKDQITEDYDDDLLLEDDLEFDADGDDFQIDETIPEEDFEIDEDNLDEEEYNEEVEQDGDWVEILVDNYTPSDETEDVYQQIVGADKLEDLKDLLRDKTLFPLEMDDEQLDQLFKFESEFVLSELGIEEA